MKKVCFIIVLIVLLSMVLVTAPATAQKAKDAVSYWTFDEGDGSIAYDSVGINDGTLAGSPVPGWDEGIVNGGLSFSGEGYVDCGNDPSLSPTNEITIEMWVKPAVTMDYFTEYTTFCVHGGGMERFFYMEGIIGLGLTDDMSETTFYWWPVCLQQDVLWYHLAFTATAGGQVYLYICGYQFPLGDAPASLKSNCDYFHISDASAFEGMIDEVVLYDRALTHEEIKGRYESAAQLHPYWEVIPGKKLVGTGWLGYQYVENGDIHRVRGTSFLIKNPDSVEDVTIERLRIFKYRGGQHLIYDGPLCLVWYDQNPASKSVNYNDVIRRPEFDTLPMQQWVSMDLASWMPDGEGGYLTYDEAHGTWLDYYTVEVYYSGEGLDLTGTIEITENYCIGAWDPAKRERLVWSTPMVNMEQKAK